MRTPRVKVRKKAAKNKGGVRYYLVAYHGLQPCWVCQNDACKVRHWSPTARCSKCGEGVELMTARREEWIKGRSFDGKREAEDAAAVEQERLSSDGTQRDSEMTFASFLLDRFLPWLHRRVADHDLRLNTLATVQVYVESQIIPRLGHIRLRDLRATDLDEFYNCLREDGRLHRTGGLAPKTVRNIAQVTYQALDYAQRKGFLRANPAINADAQNVPTVKTETWTAQQVRYFITHEAVTEDRLVPRPQRLAGVGAWFREHQGRFCSRTRAGGVMVSQPIELRPISNEEGNRLLRMVRRGAGNVVTWRRAQIVLWAAQGYRVSRIAEIGFTSEDRVREVIHISTPTGSRVSLPSMGVDGPPSSIRALGLRSPGSR
jgi:hypothetical protein